MSNKSLQLSEKPETSETPDIYRKKLTRKVVDHLFKMDDVETLMDIARILKIRV